MRRFRFTTLTRKKRLTSIVWSPTSPQRTFTPLPGKKAAAGGALTPGVQHGSTQSFLSSCWVFTSLAPV